MEQTKKFYQHKKFLLSKEHLDQKSFSEKIIKKLMEECNHFNEKDKLKVLDCGCGIGSTVRHLANMNIDVYRLIGIDIKEDLIDEAKLRKYDLPHSFLKKCDPEYQLENVYNLINPYYFPDSSDVLNIFKTRFHLVCCISLLEHVDVDRTLGVIWNSLEEGGVVWAPINYDGVTIFEPGSSSIENQKMIANFDNISIKGQVYEGQVSGNPNCGRELFDAFERNSYDIIAIDSEDWVVSPLDDFPYKKEYLKFIVEQIVSANTHSAWNRLPIVQEAKNGEISKEDIKYINQWANKINKKIDNNECLFICHQMGILAKRKNSKLLIKKLSGF